jgi:uncharacterized protein (DUF2236 family)
VALIEIDFPPVPLGKWRSSRPEDGYFPPGNILREVMSEHLVGLHYGQRALMIGALNVPAFVGTFEHTAGRRSPFNRLARTGKIFESIYFGDKAEADEVLGRVHKLHSHVHGELAADEGPYPAGTRYDAFDPELMLWTMAVIADSAEYFYELFVRRLDAGEREELWQQWIRFAELFGMPRSAAPSTYPEFRSWYDGFLTSEGAHLTDRARLIGAGVGLEIPFAFPEELVKPLHDLIIRGSLPHEAQMAYGLSWTRAQRVAFAGAVRIMRAQRTLTPGAMRRGRNTRLFERVDAEERRRIAACEPTPRYV